VLKVVTPAHAAGAVPVVVRNSDGQTASAGSFTYLPATPQNLTAVGGERQIALAWSAAAGAEGYEILRATASSGPYSVVGSSATTTYVDGGLANGVRWYYVVRATSSAGPSASSKAASAITALPPPTGLTATPGKRRVTLAWTATPGATRYAVLRSTVPGGPYAAVANPTGTTYTNTGLTSGTTYYYVVEARTAVARSVSSAEVSARAQ
jgi:cellulose 1,4-beta-cellobiosidase